jgi:hypothetical protein
VIVGMVVLTTLIAPPASQAPDLNATVRREMPSPGTPPPLSPYSGATAYIDAVPGRVDPGLTETERAILACGLVEWEGPAARIDRIARVPGFADKQALFDGRRTIAHALRLGEPISPSEWPECPPGHRDRVC